MKRRGRALRAIGILLAAGLLSGACAAWWHAAHWEPSAQSYPVQGAWIDARHTARDVLTLAEGGEGGKPLVRFVYATASIGASARNDRFAEERERAGRSGIPFGAVHQFDPCVPADRQSANFVTMVPRDADMLPPVLALERTSEDCPERVSRAAIQSELMTLVNQIEAHAGQPLILKISPQFEERYGIAARIERNLWLERDWFEPDYGGRPWLLWTANGELQTEAAEGPLRWVVVRP